MLVGEDWDPWRVVESKHFGGIMPLLEQLDDTKLDKWV